MKGIEKAERICLAAIVVVILVYLYWDGAVVRLKEVNTKLARADQDAYLHYAVRMYNVLHGDETFRSRGAQAPLYPILLALVYEPALTEEEYFVRGKYVSVVLSLILLGCLFFIFRRHLPLLPSVNLILVTAFTVFLFRASAFHAEPLFYSFSFCSFLLLCKMLVKPSWKLGILTGFVSGVTYLAKPSVLPALGLFFLFSVAKASGPFCARLVKDSQCLSFSIGYAGILPAIGEHRFGPGHFPWHGLSLHSFKQASFWQALLLRQHDLLHVV